MSSCPDLPLPSAAPHRRPRLVIALLLCGIVGPLGAHRFYAGKFVSGALQLLMTLSVGAWVAIEFPFHNGALDLFLLLQQLVALLVAGIWPSLDFGRLLCGKFKDREGNAIKE